MAGEVKRLIDELIELRTKGRPELDPFVRVHLVLSGIDPSGYTETSPADPATEGRLRKMIADFRASSGGR